MSRKTHIGAGGVFIAKKRRQETHLCVVPGCECRIRKSLLMCPAHWHQVPQHLQDTVGTAWEEYKYFPGNPAAVTAYANARRAAIDAVRRIEMDARRQKEAQDA